MCDKANSEAGVKNITKFIGASNRFFIYVRYCNLMAVAHNHHICDVQHFRCQVSPKTEHTVEHRFTGSRLFRTALKV